jgi:hypothetical protein
MVDRADLVRESLPVLPGPASPRRTRWLPPLMFVDLLALLADSEQT